MRDEEAWRDVQKVQAFVELLKDYLESEGTRRNYGEMLRHDALSWVRGAGAAEYLLQALAENVPEEIERDYHADGVRPLDGCRETLDKARKARQARRRRGMDR